MTGNPLKLENMNVDVHQCAWCRTIADRHGEYTIASDSLVDGSHGMCAPCAHTLIEGARVAWLAKARHLPAAA